MWQIISLSLGGCAYWIDVIQQLAGTVQHLLLVALDRAREIAADSALAGRTQGRLVKVVDVAVDLLDRRVALAMSRRVIPASDTN